MWKTLILCCAIALFAQAQDTDTTVSEKSSEGTTETSLPTELETSTEPAHSSPTTLPTDTPTATPSKATTPEPTSPPTVPPVTPTPNAPGFEDFSMDLQNSENKTCLSVKLAAQFELNYVINATKNGTVHINLPKNATFSKAGSSCNTSDQMQSLAVFWDNFRLTFMFGKYETTVALMTLNLNYNITNKDFPDAQPVAGQQTTSLVGEAFNSSLKSTYKCNSEQTFDMSHDNKVFFKDVSLTIFSDGADRTGELCALDDITSDIVPIAVGCALAGLVVVVLIAYLVGRRRSRQKGYQSV